VFDGFCYNLPALRVRAHLATKLNKEQLLDLLPHVSAL
jgi:hypothetical protein